MEVLEFSSAEFLEFKFLVKGKDLETGEPKNVWVDFPTSPEHLLEVAGIDADKEKVIYIDAPKDFDKDGEFWFDRLNNYVRVMMDVRAMMLSRMLGISE